MLNMVKCEVSALMCYMLIYSCLFITTSSRERVPLLPTTYPHDCSMALGEPICRLVKASKVKIGKRAEKKKKG